MSLAAPLSPGGLTAPRRAVAIFAVLSAMALVVLDAGIANLALPTLAQAFDATPARAVMVVTGYQTGLVVALLPCGALGERFGHRRVFVLGVATFVLGAALCALAPSLPWLVAARVVQGLGGAAVMALGVALLRSTVPPGRLGAAIGWNALTVALASAVAPSVGAAILATDGRWIFVAGLPLAALALAAAPALPAGPRRRGGLDGVSMALNAAVFALLVWAAAIAADAPGIAALLLAAGAASGAALLRRESPKAQPMLPLDLLRSRSFRLSAVASVCCFAGQSAGLVALPFHLQQGLHQTATSAGLYLTAWPLGVAATALIAGRLADRVPTAWLCAIGGAGLAAGLAGVAAWTPDGDPRRLLPLIVLCGAGFGLFQSPNNRNLFLSAPADRSGAAGGMQGAARVSGQTAGASAMSLIFALAPVAAAPRIGLATAAGMALAAGLVSLARTRS